MLKIEKSILVAPMVGFLMSFGGQAVAVPNNIGVSNSGNVCHPEDGKTAEWGWTPNYGIFRSCSTCTGSANVVCPVDHPNLGNGGSSGVVSLLQLALYDRSSSADVSCTVYFNQADGTVTFSTTLHSTGNQAGAQFPLTSMSLNSGTFTNVTAYCNVPAATASGFSHVSNIFYSGSIP